MNIDDKTLRNFGACDAGVKNFVETFPNGLDISGLWGGEEMCRATWRTLLDHPLTRRYVGWAMQVGMLPPVTTALEGADLHNINFRNVDLRGADLREADLRDANLWNASLRGADLRGAALKGANLQGADLKGAILR